MGFMALGHNQFEQAKWIPQGEHAKNHYYKIIRLSQVREKTRNWANPAGNILAESSHTYISTYFRADYQINDLLYWRGKYWQIAAITETTDDIAPQALRLVKAKYRAVFIMELYEDNKNMGGITQ